MRVMPYLGYNVDIDFCSLVNTKSRIVVVLGLKPFSHSSTWDSTGCFKENQIPYARWAISFLPELLKVCDLTKWNHFSAPCHFVESFLCASRVLIFFEPTKNHRLIINGNYNL